jgi:hypothetical protein
MPERSTTQTSEGTEKASARSAILLAVVVLIVAAASVEFGLQTLVWVEAKNWASANPWLLEVPLALPPQTSQSMASPLNARTEKPPKPVLLKAYDYQFRAPWPGHVKMTSAQIDTEFRFDSGQVIVFFDPQAQLDTVREMKAKNPVGYQQLLNVFGDQAANSNYALYKAVYGASPAVASPFLPRQDALRINGALLYKLSFGFDVPSGIHSFDFGKNRGFQFGDPANGRPVALRVFDDRDDQFRFIILSAAGSNAQITQADVDLAIQSLEAIPILER